MGRNKDMLEEILEDGVKQGQQEVGAPVGIPPITKEERKEAGKKIVAAWYVRLWNWLTGKE